MARLSHAHSDARTSAAALLDRPAVRKDRSIDSRAVPCPDCKAAVGQTCVNRDGTSTSRHASRRRMALRAETATYNLSDIRFAVLMKPSTRRELLRRSGLNTRGLARRLDMKYERLRDWMNGTNIPAGPEGARLGIWLRERQAIRSEPVVAPPIDLPPEPSLRSAFRSIRESMPSRLDAGSECESCGKWLPGERRLCGRCFSTQGRAS